MTRVALLLIFLLVPESIHAATYVVKPDGTGDFPTIQAAIDEAEDGDIIELTDGTFTGDGNRDIDYLGKAITVTSQSGAPTRCIIDCQGSESEPHRGFQFQSGEGSGSILRDILITNGSAERGGAILCISASPEIARCDFRTNHAFGSGKDDGGGAVYCDQSSSPAMVNCTFKEDSANF